MPFSGDMDIVLRRCIGPFLATQTNYLHASMSIDLSHLFQKDTVLCSTLGLYGFCISKMGEHICMDPTPTLAMGQNNFPHSKSLSWIVNSTSGVSQQASAASASVNYSWDN